MTINPWMLAPVLLLGTTVAFCVAISVIAYAVVKPRAVERNPWLASLQEDAKHAARGRFVAEARQLSVAAATGSVTFTLAGPATVAAWQVRLYRPNDPAQDRLVPWPDGARPLVVTDLAAGAWQASVSDLGGTWLSEAALSVP